MGYHDHSLIVTLTEGFDDVLHQSAVSVVESVEGLVENEQFRVFHECAQAVPAAARRWRVS